MTDRKPIEQGQAMKNGRPGGTTDWKGSITERGTTMDSYYGRPIVKEPVWNPEIPYYFFTGGLAGASAVLHGVAKLTGNERLSKSALYVGEAADAQALAPKRYGSSCRASCHTGTAVLATSAPV